MTEPLGTTPEQQAIALGQQAAPPPAGTTPPGTTPQANPNPNLAQQVATPDETLEKRFAGAIRKLEELTIANRNLESQLVAKTSEMERLSAQLTNKDIEKTVAVGERDKNLETVLKAKQTSDTELGVLRAFKAKVDMAHQLGHPELIGIIQNIPDIADAEVLKVVMSDFVKFREDGIKAREQTLLSGITPSVSPVQSTTPLPSTSKSWQEHISGLPIGSAERTKAMDQWGQWEIDQSKKP